MVGGLLENALTGAARHHSQSSPRWKWAALEQVPDLYSGTSTSSSGAPAASPAHKGPRRNHLTCSEDTTTPRGLRRKTMFAARLEPPPPKRISEYRLKPRKRTALTKVSPGPPTETGRAAAIDGKNPPDEPEAGETDETSQDLDKVQEEESKDDGHGGEEDADKADEKKDIAAQIYAVTK